MARVRRIADVEPEAPEHVGEPITDADRLDPRVFLSAPDAVQREGASAVLAWASRNAPQYVRNDEDVLRNRAVGAAQRAYWQACFDARRRGLPKPDLRDFLPGLNAAPGA